MWEFVKFESLSEPIPSTSAQSEPVVKAQIPEKSNKPLMLDEESDDAEITGEIGAGMSLSTDALLSATKGYTFSPSVTQAYKPASRFSFIVNLPTNELV